MPLKPNEVKTENITNRAVTSPKIADEAVTARKLDERAVTTEKLATNAVTGSKLAANAVTAGKIRNGTVRADEIAAGAITTAKIGVQQVIGSRIKDRTITSDKLANSAVTTSKIADRSVTKAKLSFELPEPGEGGVARPLTPPVATDEIADASVTADKLATDSVTQTKIARNTVGWSEIRTQSLEPEQIKTLSGLPPTPGQVPVYDESEGNQWWFRWADAATRPLTPQVATEEIADGAVTYPKIGDEQVNYEKLATDAVTTIKIQNGAVTPAKLSFTPLARPLTPPVTTDEIGDGQVTPAKLSFTPPAGMTPIATVNLLNESSANDIDQIIDLDAYIPAGANFALVQLRTSAGQAIISPTVSEVIWDDYMTEPIFLANLNQGMIVGSVVSQSGPVQLYGPSAPSRAIRVTHLKNGQTAVTQVYLYGYA